MVPSVNPPRFSARVLVPLIGFALAVYFSWPLAQGERSYPRLLLLEHKIAAMQQSLDSVRHDRETLEHKVVRLRPNSIDPDLLEEQARAILGYQYPEDKMILLRP